MSSQGIYPNHQKRRQVMNTPFLRLLSFLFTFLLLLEVATPGSLNTMPGLDGSGPKPMPECRSNCSGHIPLPPRKPNCTSNCGDILVPYPFGLDDAACSYNFDFTLFCNHSSKPPKLTTWGNGEIINVSFEGQITALSTVSYDCYNKRGNSTGWNLSNSTSASNLFTVSDTENSFTALGCNTIAVIDAEGYNGNSFVSGCSTFCVNEIDVINGSCAGRGCCQISIAKGFASFSFNPYNFQSSHASVPHFNSCSYLFIVQTDWFKFSPSYLSNFTSEYVIEDVAAVPVVYDWAIELKSCEEAVNDSTNYACRNRSDCVASKNGIGYSCVCSKGFQGNPYLEDGCQDVDECKSANLRNCSENAKCKNSFGGYDCYCPFGYDGDGWKRGTSHYGASRKGSACRTSNIILIIAGVSVCTIAVPTFIFFIYWAITYKKRRMLKFFKQNGGMLLQQQIALYKGVRDIAQIFTIKELKRATKNFDRSEILGEGGFGTVYRGILPGGKIVAIKKSKTMDQTQIIQFINEVDILSQINHRHVVKLLGCCLQTEVPLLVYEFVSNGTLYQLIHGENTAVPFSWEDRLRIAAETADALAYLHSSHSVPIFHRDVKSSNILLDDKYSAKVSDFGASRLVPVDQTHKTTQIQGTYGYLDPECLPSGHLTDKSDVYSFGVVLAELLTGKKPIFMDGSGERVVLAKFLPSSMKSGNLFHILDDRIKEDDGKSQQFLIVAEIASYCLEDRREDRPTMKEVVRELDSLKMVHDQSASQHIQQETDLSPGGVPTSPSVPTLEIDNWK